MPVNPLRIETASLCKLGVVLENTVILILGSEGRMPTVLVDPVDAQGVQIPGLWLGDGENGLEFVWTERFCHDVAA